MIIEDEECEMNQSQIETVRDLEERRYRAMADRDVAALDALLADELVYTHSSSARDSKSSYLEALRAGRLDYERIEHPEEEILVSGDTAVVVGRMQATVLVNGARRSLDSATLAVWVRRDGRWQLLAYQSTPRPA
jgi:uncharacterized protein (TIGR02246 family)